MYYFMYVVIFTSMFTAGQTTSGNEIGGLPSLAFGMDGFTECSSIPNIPTTQVLRGNSLAIMDGLIYSFGGQISGPDPGSKAAYRYDPETENWVTLASLKQGRHLSAVIGLSEIEILIAGNLSLKKSNYNCLARG